MKSVMDIAQEAERKALLKLTPIERLRTMHNRFLEILAIMARAEKVSEYEIYRRYLITRDNVYRRTPRQ
jgi:arginyl-tRNA--protein-N-Asp/Glu arginylyltransferase